MRQLGAGRHKIYLRTVWHLSGRFFDLTYASRTGRAIPISLHDSLTAARRRCGIGRLRRVDT